MAHDKTGINAKLLKDSVVIVLPLDTLTHSQKLRPHGGYNITDKKKMAEYIIKKIIWHTRDVGDEETGASVFTNLLDDMFDYAYEYGETWLEEIPREE